MMEHGASESIEEQSLMELTIKTKVKTVAYIDHDTDLNQLKQEPGLVQYVKIEPTFLVKKEILDDSIQAVPHTDGNEPQRVQGASTSGGTASVNEPCSTSLGNLLNVKHELDDMYIGPTMLQHMDIHYAINKNTSAVAEENSIVDDYNEAIPGNEAKKESVEDESRDKKASCKYYRKTKTEGDYGKAHLKSCFDQQKKLQQTTNQMRVHTGEKPFQCNKCDVKFGHRHHLTRHMRVHTGEKPYQCDICDARLGDRRSLTGHLRVHSGEKPYQCDKCDARFGQRHHLTQHMRVHTGEKPYQCDTCNAQFVTHTQLTMHMRVHTGEKPYQCKMCNARFSRRYTLTRHMRVHTGEKPYQCDTCRVKFGTRTGRTMHMRVHTGEKPYQCDMCDARFRHRFTLTRHMRIHTDEKPYQPNTPVN